MLALWAPCTDTVLRLKTTLLLPVSSSTYVFPPLHRLCTDVDVLSSLLQVFFFNLAWGPLAWVVATELSVGKNRQKIMSVGTAFFWLSAFVVTFTMPYLYDATEANLEAQIGYIYAGGSLIGMVFVYFCIPETLGRSLEEINCAYTISSTCLTVSPVLERCANGQILCSDDGREDSYPRVGNL